MLRLFTKRQIDQQKSVERQREIEEGLKLTRRVDALRELEADESASLEKFRAKTIEQIHKDISAKKDTFVALASEVADLENRKREALLPLIRQLADEVEMVEQLKKKVDEDIGELVKREKQLQLEKQEVDSLKDEVSNELTRVQGLKKQYFELASEADEKRKTAEALIQEATQNKNTVDAYVKDLVSNAKQKEVILAIREETILSKEKLLQVKGKELEIAQRRTEDQYNTYVQEFNRLKKQHVKS